MTAIRTSEGFINMPSALTSATTLGSLFAPDESDLDADSRATLSILGRTLFFLSLGAVAVVGITGQLPLFFLPLGLFLFFGSALQWKSAHPARSDRA